MLVDIFDNYTICILRVLVDNLEDIVDNLEKSVDKSVDNLVEEISDVDYKSNLDLYRIVVIDFWAIRCAGCKTYARIFEAGAGYFHDRHVRFYKCNTDDNPKLVQKFKVMSLPTTVFIYEGEEVDRYEGTMTLGKLMNKVGEVLTK